MARVFSHGARGDKYVCFAGTMNKSRRYLKVFWMLLFNDHTASLARFAGALFRVKEFFSR
jgi:hypothetical protein